MARNDDNLKSLYATLQREGYTPPEYETFVKDMEDDANLQEVHNTLKQEGYTPPAFDVFKTDLLGETPAAQPQGTQFFKLRRGGKDFTVSTDEVNAAGGLSEWAKSTSGDPIGVYMIGKNQSGKNERRIVPLSLAHRRSKKHGYKYETVGTPIKEKDKYEAPVQEQDAEVHGEVPQVDLSGVRNSEDFMREIDSMLPGNRGKHREREMQARIMGLDTKLPGLIAPAAAEDAAGADSTRTGEEPALNPNKPQVYDVVLDEAGNPSIEWQLNNGRLTQDRNEADVNAYESRQARLILDRRRKEQRYKDQYGDMMVAPLKDGSKTETDASQAMPMWQYKMQEDEKLAAQQSYAASREAMESEISREREALATIQRERKTAKGDDEGALMHAERLSKDRIAKLENNIAHINGKGEGFWGMLGRQIFDVRGWDFGATDFGLYTYRSSIAEKIEKGEALTPAEKQLAEAMARDESTFENLSSMEQYGQMTGQSVTFVKDFGAAAWMKGAGVLSRVFGIGSKMTNATARRIVSAYARNAGKNAAKMGAADAAALAKQAQASAEMSRLILKATGATIDDVVMAGAVTLGPQGMSTAAKIGNAKVGNVVKDENGNIRFENGTSLGDAIYEQGMDALIENYSEVFGVHLDGRLGIGKWAGKKLEAVAKSMNPGVISNTLLRATSPAAKASMERARHIFEKLGISDFSGEVAEEYVGQGVRQAFGLESAYTTDAEGRRISNFQSPEFHKDIWFGMALSIGFMNAMKSPIVAVDYVSNRHRLKKAENVASTLLGAEVFDEVRQVVESSDNSSIVNNASNVLAKFGKNEEQKDAILNYVVRTMEMRGYNLGEGVRSSDDSPESDLVGSAFSEGYDATEPQDMNDAQNMYERQLHRLEDCFSGVEKEEFEKVLNSINEDPMAAIDNVCHPDQDADVREAVIDYINAKALRDGLIQRVRDDIDEKITQSEVMVRGRINKGSGMIHPAVMDLDERRVYVVGGNVVANEDGTIDRDASDDFLIVRDTKSGKLSTTYPKAIKSVEKAINPEEELATTAEAIRQQAAQEAADKMNGALSFNPGEVTTIINGEDEYQVTIVGPTVDKESGMPVDGQVIVKYEDGTQASFMKDELQQMADAANTARLERFEQERAAANAPQAQSEEGVDDDSPETDNSYDGVTEDAPQQSALERIPLNQDGKPDFAAVEPDLAWDGIVEKTGDERIAQAFVDNMIAASEKKLKQAEKVKAQESEDIDEFMASENARIKAIDNAKAVHEHWKKVAGTKQLRETERRNAEEAEARRHAQERAEEEARQKAEREEAARIEREALNGVPDWAADTPTDARARSYRRVGSEKVDRPAVINNPATGNAVEVRFGDKIMPKAHIAVIEASQLQPSHRDGHRNPSHFLDEAQPKERKDAASRFAAAKIAEEIRPEEITSSVTAFTGAPSVNARGEVIQGNNRSEALRIMYERNAQSAAKYKQYLSDHAAEFGLTPDVIASFEQPVLVNMLDVSDAEAITLGQYVAQDTESGGVERIKPRNAVQKMGENAGMFADILLRSADDEATFSQLVDANGVEALKWLNRQGIITDTQYASAFDSRGNLTAEASNDLKGIMYQSIFTGGSTRLEEMFNNLATKAQRALLATAFRDHNSTYGDRMIGEIQQSIIAYNALMSYEQFRDATSADAIMNAVESWKKQTAFDDVSGETYLPSETFSNFALMLAFMYKGRTQKHIQSVFNAMYDIVQGTEEDNLFETADKTPKPLAEAIHRVLDIEYKPVAKKTNGTDGGAVLDSDSENGQGGRSGSDGNTDSPEQRQNEAEPTGSGAGAADDGGEWGEVAPQSKSFDYFAGSVGELIILAKKSAKGLIKKVIAPISDRLQKDLSSHGVEIGKEYKHVIDNNAIRQALKNHGSQQEEKRGQIPLIDADFDRIEDVVTNYDHIRIEKGKRNDVNIVYSKSYGDGITIFVEEKRDGRKELAAVTMWKKKNSTHTDANHKVTPISDSSEVSVDKGNTSFADKQADSEKSFQGFAEMASAEPTEAQKAAGNYKKEHRRVDGYNISIETPKGSVRSGTNKDKNGNETPWETVMQNDYGYIRGTEGVDGDHIDVFLSDTPEDGDVFVVDQVNEDGSFDEHKVMYGFPTEQAARDAYLSNYEPGWTGLGAITHVSKDEFKKWIQSSRRKTKPFAEYKSVKSITEDVDQTRTNVNEEGMVVDGEGNPLTLYHGTPNDIEALSELEAGHPRKGEDEPARFNGDGVSFTPHRDVAEDYASLGDGNKGKVFEANIVLKNPYYTVGVANFTPEEAAEFTASLKAKGHDGIINYASQSMRQTGAEPNEVIVFDIKSATPVGADKQADSGKSSAKHGGKGYEIIEDREGYSIEVRHTKDGDSYAVRLKKNSKPSEWKKDVGEYGVWSSDGRGEILFDSFEAMTKYLESRGEDVSALSEKAKWIERDKEVNDRLYAETGLREGQTWTGPDGTRVVIEARGYVKGPDGWDFSTSVAYPDGRKESTLTPALRIVDFFKKNGYKQGTDKPESLDHENNESQSGTARPVVREKIEDFGEKIAGARKDMLKDVAKSVENVTVQSLIELPISKAFKKPPLKKLVDSGIISDSDAVLAEAVMQGLIYAKKKPALTRKPSSKREITAWAEETYKGIKLLGEILSGDENRKSAAMAGRRDELALKLKAANEYIAKMREWNPGHKFADLESIPDAVEVIQRILEGTGYRAGDKVELPLTRVELSSDGSHFMVSASGKQGAYWFSRYYRSLDDAVDTMILAAKLSRGDMDVELPQRQYSTRGVGQPHLELTGKYVVGYMSKNGLDYKEAIFDSEEKAAAFAKEKNGKVSPQKRYTHEYDKYVTVVTNPLTGNSHPIGEEYDTRAEAVAWRDENAEALNAAALEAIYKETGAKGTSRPHFYIGSTYSRRRGRMIFSVIADDKSNPWPIVKDFESRQEAESWLADNIVRLEAERKANREAERAVVYFDNAGERHGDDYRGGKDATPEMFTDAFGFRGVQFGNWTNDADRQAALNQAYDALMDMAHILGLKSRSLSLDGELGLAFGARGNGQAAAHYEPTEVVINLTKTQGAGSLAHEWWHAVDNFLSRRAGVPTGYASSRNGIDAMNRAVAAAIDEMMADVEKSEYFRRSKNKGAYWGSPTEVMARLFASWIAWRLKGKDRRSPFLASELNPKVLKRYQSINYLLYRANERMKAVREQREPNIMTAEEFYATPDSLVGYPYPTDAELIGFAPRIENLFSTLAERESESGSIAKERGRRYAKSQMTGMSLFDWADKAEREQRQMPNPNEEALAAEEANTALCDYSAAYREYVEQSVRLEKAIVEAGAKDEEAEALREHLAAAEEQILDARERLKEKLREYYIRENTPSDAERIARDMTARAEAEVDISLRKEQYLRDVLERGEDPVKNSTAEKSTAIEVKTAGGYISYNAEGHLPDTKAGEFAYMERQFSRSGEFQFTGDEYIKDRGDVAYMFRALEDYSIEHVFAVLVRDGRAKILHLGMGGPTASYANLNAIRAGYDAFGADKIYLVHNHPSGTLTASTPDMRLMKRLEEAFGRIAETEGIIIDTTSGRYSVFNSNGVEERANRPMEGGNVEAEVIRFDRVERHENQDASVVIGNSEDVARFVSEQRLGSSEKVSYIVLTNGNEIVGNFHTDRTRIDEAGFAEELASVATKFGGTSVIVYGNTKISGAAELGREVAKYSLDGVRLLDALEVTNGMRYSAADLGMLRESGAEYGVDGAEEEDVLCRPVTDKATLDRLNSEPTIKVYRAMQMIDGGLRPPMSGKVDGQWRDATEVGVWEEAEEHPEMADENGRFKLDKGNGKSIKAAYNPYIHTSRSPINDQFSSAWSRPELVIVEVEIPESELTSGYHAEKAKNTVGEMEWKSGPVGRVLAKIGQPRRVILSRWSRIIRVVPVEEVAEAYAQRLNAHGIEVPFNTVPPALREALVERGVKIGKPEKGNAGKASMPAFEQWLNEQERMRMSDGRERFSKERQAENAMCESERMASRIRELAERMHLDNVDIVTDASQLEGKRASAKGYYNRRTGKITIVIPNNLSTIDAEQTLLHEAVAHFGLRKLFGEQFNTFLDNVYESADKEIRRKIVAMAAENGWDFRTATEEYLAGLAENMNFEEAQRHRGWWLKIKDLFLSMVEKIGFRGFRDNRGIVLGDNELRYILWRSYKNLTEPGGARGIMAEATDVVKQSELKVGNYAERGIEAEYAVEPISDINDNFNNQIDRWTNGEMKSSEYVNAGTPQGVMRAFMPSVPIIIRQKVLTKSKKKHALSADQIKDLPGALANPIFVFKKGNNTVSVLTELQDGNGQNLFVSIEIGVDKQLGHEFLEVNDILTIHGREAENIVFPILDNNTLKWVDKTKGLNWLSSAKTNSQAITKETLSSAAKVVKTFENPTIEEEDLFRPGDFAPRDKVLARDTYERMVSKGSFQFQEAMQDSMLGLKKLYEAILGKEGRHIEEVGGYENAYLYENRMSSANNGQQHEYFIRYMQPLLKEIGRIAGADESKRRELTDYMMAKHGLERNAHMRAEAEKKGEDADRDFAGLVGLTGEADWRSAEATAQQWVDDYESTVDTAELWKAVNNATKATLEKVYLSGIISKSTYEEIRDMYEYYIPLRGWDEKTSEQVYGYLTSKDGPLGGSIMKKAGGRESKADDPIATIAMMADAAISQGNRNLMKQRFLTFVLNHPSDAVSVHDVWLEYDDVTGEWRPVFADVEPGDSAEEVEQKIEAFEQRMEALKKASPDKYKRGREADAIPYKVVKGHLREHQVLIKRNGRTYVATINGNPRAAQALNGLTNPDVEQNGAVGNLLRAGEWINRQLSAFYTTRNPDFVVSNFVRDMVYSNCMTWVKESPRYALRFHKNFGMLNPAMMRKLLGKWEKGSLDRTDKYENLFYEFMMNGGETGYTSVRDIESQKRAVSAELKKQGNVGREAWAALGMQMDLLNRSVENCARFAAYVTSRECGRSIDRSVYDAKEVSVNFNKKGSGGKMVNAVGQSGMGKVGSYLGGIGRVAFVFWNAGLQGMTNFGRQAVRHPAKFVVEAATLYAMGYMIPLLAQAMGGGDGDDDDRNAYYNLPEYIRRSNICFRAGEQWVTIPLPIEYRAMYGLGELCYGVISGNERYGNEDLSRQLAAQVSQILPLDMLEGGGGHAFIPSAFKPFTEAYIMNEGWTGLPVYKDTPYNKNEPDWTKAYASADVHLVDFARWASNTSGGNDYKKGDVDINPARLEYLLNGTFGGMMTFPNKIKKMVETGYGARDFEWRNVPIVNRLIKSGDERTAFRKLRNEYYKYMEEYKETGRLMRSYRKAADEGIMGYAEEVNFLENSPEALRYEITDMFRGDIEAYYDRISEEKDKARKTELEAEMYGVMREHVDAMHDPAAFFRGLYEDGRIGEESVRYLEKHHGIKLEKKSR